MRNLILSFFVLYALTGCGVTTEDTTTEDVGTSENISSESTDQESYTSSSQESDEDDDNDDEENDYETAYTTPVTDTTVTPDSRSYTLLAWNDLGMHCFDGSDFSVFSILPPYNTLDAQLIIKAGTSNKHVTSGVMLSYESYAFEGKINTISSTKTNFWDYLPALFPGATSTPDVGLAGKRTPSLVPESMEYNALHDWWEAEGIPIVNRDDDNTTNYYPMVNVVAKDTQGSVLATAQVVLPVSDEMDCAKCHASNSSVDAQPSSGWENDLDAVKDYKFNILKLHDDKHPIAQADLDALAAKGYNYQATLYSTAKGGTPILCAACHSSNALGTTSVGSAPSLSSAIHAKHTNVVDPDNGMKLGDSLNRDSCYSCHPGAATECLRGAMGDARDANGDQVMQCQSCHGTMADVGNAARIPWMDEPNCQVCHQDGERYTSALVNGTLRSVVDNRFATNPNTPSLGVSLYRYSKGHGDMKCSSCHGSTHAIFPTNHAQDNMLSENVQGHSGTIAECTACHDTMPQTVTGGPHGMHTVGQDWVKGHEDVAENDPKQCTVCHGSDYRGSFLSKTFSARTFYAEGKTVNYQRGDMVTCYDCHNGPNP